MDSSGEGQGSGAGRLLSLDVFRGLTIAGMILVNNPGPSGAVYWPLEHAAWHGWTPTDLIFPFFLFIVGVSITLAFARRTAEAGGTPDRSLYLKILRRTVLIYAFGFLLAGFPYFNLSTIRLTGVLQRIAVCYFCTAVIFLKTNWRTQTLVAVVLLLGYWALSVFVAAPGYAAGDLSKEGSLASFVDRTVLGNHIWKGGGRIYDPEGLLSTIPAIASTLTGVLAGHWLRQRREAHERVAGFFVAGAACVIVGWIWNAWFPINKALWTSSYVVFTTGMALELLALCYWLVDIKNYKAWAWPFRVFGMNALAVFVLSGLMARAMSLWKIPRADGRPGNLQTYLYEHLFAPLATASPRAGSLAYALAYVLLWLGLMWLLYRRKIFLKV
ncbi:MAG TPA: heparan-alpha-glucosaminide N-acetyltransferase domain-containing protein [Pyrinomonadaceae bacterium]|nr:heparan-alpha-glucosaminide N-acetyltransferase domain-containing protein [Pyrinomonadaceae bacterium]